MLMLGNNEVILRFVPALLGVLTIPLIYFAGKEFMDRNVGIIAAAAFAFLTIPDLLFTGSPGILDDALFRRICNGLLFQGLKNK